MLVTITAKFTFYKWKILYFLLYGFIGQLHQTPPKQGIFLCFYTQLHVPVVHVRNAVTILWFTPISLIRPALKTTSL